jgi:3-oxoacyl-[acyl-carrier protein] reductase
MTRAILITGASSGIGAATARALAAPDAAIALHAR